MKNTKISVAAAIAASVMVTAMAPETALAHNTTKKHSHAKKSHSSSAAVYSSSSSSVERRLQAMQDEIDGLRSELARAKTTAPAKVQEIETRQAQVEQQVAANTAHLEKHDSDDLVFFRGGYAHSEHGRNNELLLNSTTYNSLGLTNNTNYPNNSNGWYAGAGFDFRLTDDVWGLTDLAAVDAELMFQYMNFGTGYNSFVDLATNNAIGAGGTSTVKIKNQVTQFTLTASPKIKFNVLDGALRPWIIPFGLAINVISPPSSGVTVLNPGLMLGTGLEYNIWKNLWAGVDFRYQWTGNDLNYKANIGGLTVYNSTNTDGLFTGGYIGFGF